MLMENSSKWTLIRSWQVSNKDRDVCGRRSDDKLYGKGTRRDPLSLRELHRKRNIDIVDVLDLSSALRIIRHVKEAPGDARYALG